MDSLFKIILCQQSEAVLSALLFYFLIEHCVKYWYNNYAQHVHYI